MTSNNLQTHTVKHFKDVFYGPSFTGACLKDNLRDITWQQAVAKVEYFNTIATLTYHVSYYVSDALMKVLEGGPLTSKDEYSFSHPPIESQEDWDNFLAKVWADVDRTAALIEQMPESQYWNNFDDEKYGSYFHNIYSIIEHAYYHIGQIGLIRKLVIK